MLPCSLYISDSTNKRVCKVSSSGIITTVAGTGYINPNYPNRYGGFLGDGGLASSARLNNPQGLAVSADGRWAWLMSCFVTRCTGACTVGAQ